MGGEFIDMKILVTGSNGMLGSDIVKIFEKDHEVFGVTKQDFDITDINASIEYIKNIKPDVIIHCAAYTNVDGCESNIDIAYTVNALGTRNIAITCNEVNASMVYISSDYVYDGNKNSPYYEYDIPNPMSVYGKSKLEGENFVKSLCKKHYIVRTSWLFGKNGNNFIKTMLNLAKDKKIISVVNDQVGSPTYTEDLAKALLQLISKPAYGTYHITNEDFCSWYDLTKYIFEVANVTGVKVIPITTEELNRLAPRPKNSRLEKFYLRLNKYNVLRSYKDAVREYISTI